MSESSKICGKITYDRNLKPVRRVLEFTEMEEYSQAQDAGVEYMIEVDQEDEIDDDCEWKDYNLAGRIDYKEYPPIRHANELEWNVKYPIVAIRRICQDMVKSMCNI